MLSILRFFIGIFLVLVALFCLFYVPISGQTAWQRIKTVTPWFQETFSDTSRAALSKDAPPMDNLTPADMKELDELVAKKVKKRQ